MIRAFLSMVLASAACAPLAHADIASAVEKGQPILFLANQKEEGLQIFESVERRGAFSKGAQCLQLQVEKKLYTPIFTSREIGRLAAKDGLNSNVTAGAPTWSLVGGPVSADLQDKYSQAAETCSRPIFIVGGISDPT